jgi:hypothetical protein
MKNLDTVRVRYKRNGYKKYITLGSQYSINQSCVWFRVFFRNCIFTKLVNNFPRKQGGSQWFMTVFTKIGHYILPSILWFQHIFVFSYYAPLSPKSFLLQVRSRIHTRTHVMGVIRVFTGRGQKCAYKFRLEPFKTICIDRPRAAFLNCFFIKRMFLKHPQVRTIFNEQFLYHCNTFV